MPAIDIAIDKRTAGLPGPIILVPQKDAPQLSFPKDNEADPAEFAAFVEALEELVERGLAKRVSDDLVRLTSNGFSLARAIE